MDINDFKYILIIIKMSNIDTISKNINFGLAVLLAVGYNRFTGLRTLQQLYRFAHLLLLISPNIYIHYKVHICRSHANIKYVLLIYLLVFIFLAAYNKKLKNNKD